MPRAPYPHEALVQGLRRILCGMRSSHSISDDMDQFYAGAAGYSPWSKSWKRTREVMNALKPFRVSS